MITKNLKNLMNLLFISDGSNTQSPGTIEAKDFSGTTRYLTPCFSNFPYQIPVNFNTSLTAGGYKVGTGTTAPTENDYHLTNQITSGITGSTIVFNRGTDSDGNPWIAAIITLTNSTASDITITEAGIVATFYGSTTAGTTTNSTSNFLIDHTLLQTPLVVPANGNAVLRYERKVVWP